MNIAAGLSSPTIEGRIILTAENNMAAGFADARKDLQKFAQEFTKVQATLNAQINTSQRQQTQVARNQVRDAARVNTLIGSMFKAFVTAATGAFTALTIAGDKYNDIFLKNVESLQRTQRLLTVSTISEAALKPLLKEIARTYSRTSMTQTREETVAIAARVRTGRGEAADVAETRRRYGLLADVGVTTQRGMSDVQDTVQRAITSGRTNQLVQLLTQYHPGPMKDQELAQIRDLFETIKDPAQAEAEFFNIIEQWQKDFPKALKGASIKLAEMSQGLSEFHREWEELTDYIADQVHPLMEQYYKALAAGLHWFNSLTEEQKNAAIALGGIVVAMGGAAAAWVALNAALRGAAWALGRAVPGAAGAAGAGGAGTGLLRSKVPFVRGIGAAGLIYEGVRAGGAYTEAHGGDPGNLDSIISTIKHRGVQSPYGRDVVEDRYTREKTWMLQRAKSVAGTGSWRGGSSNPILDLGAWWEQGTPANRLKQLQGRQHGGPVSPGTPYVVGEGGPEMFTPVTSGLVSPQRGGSGRNAMARFNQSLAEATGSVNQFGSSLELVSETLMKMWLEMKEAQASGGLGGGGGDEMGGVSGSTASSGDLAANQQTAYNAFRELGYDDQSAQIAVANLSGESLRNPADVHADPSSSNPGQRAHGIASWDQTRSAAIRKQFGKSPEQMTIPEQVRAMDWELKTKYQGAYSDLTNPSLSEEQRMYGLVKKFEAPADPRGGAATRIRIKRGMKLQPWPGASGPAGRERDPLNIPQQQSSLQLGRGQVDMNVKLDRQLAMSRPTTIPASNFDLGVNVDRTGTVFSRPGDPAFPPPLPYGVA